MRATQAESAVPSPRRAEGGYTMVEILVVLVLGAIILTISVPNLLALNQRRALLGASEQVSNMLIKARYEAIRRNVDLDVAVDVPERTLFVDFDGDAVLDAEERYFGVVTLAGGVELGGPAAQPAAVTGFPGGSGSYTVGFTAGGAADTTGSVRLRDLDSRNFLEVGIVELATARMVDRKWDGSSWVDRDEGDWEWN